MARAASPFQIESLESRLFLSAAELVRNGSFEGSAVSTDWTASGSFHADSTFTSKHSGLGYAYLANADGSAGNNISGSLYQQVSIPASSTSLNLSFWTYITTAETTGSAPNDKLTMEVWNSTGTTLLQSVGTLSNLNKSSSYIRRSYALSNSLFGQTVRIVFNGSNNASLATTFRVDDVGLSYAPTPTSKRIVGYMPYYRQSLFSQMDLSLVTYLNYFSIQATDTGALSTQNVSDTNLATVVNAAHAKGVGVSMTVGPQAFTNLAASSTARATFATNIKNYLTARNLDGVDIDWEPPATGTSQANYALLIDALYKELAPLGKNITSAVNPWTKEIPVAATNEMDWVNVMCYDFDYADHSNYADSTDAMVQWSATYGADKSKLLMGTPFYGRQGTGWGAGETSTSSYTTIMSDSFTADGVYPAPDVDFSNFYYNGVDTIRKKTQYVVDNGYGGMMIWELGQDYFGGGTNKDKYTVRSLLPVMKNTLFAAQNISTISASPNDNATAKVGSAQSISVTVTGTATGAGVLTLSLVGTNATISRDYFKITAAGAYSHTFALNDTQTATGVEGYEIYAQFRPGATTGPATIISAGDESKLALYHLNWQVFPDIAASPSPVSGAALSAKPATLDWADSANATSYDVYLDSVFKANVTGSQWSTTGTTISPNVSHTWQVNAKNSASTTTGNSWTFSYNDAPAAPTNSSPANNATSVAISPTLSASAFSDIDAGDTHAASQWLVRRVSDNALIFDSGTDTINKTSIAASGLAYLTAYSWQVRYEDNHGAWSSYSTATTFTTSAPPDTTPPTLANPMHDNDVQTISATASEAINSLTGHAFVTIDGGSPIDIGSGAVNGLRVTYTLPVSLADGNYTLRIPASSISDTTGNGLAADYTTPFFILSGDVNHDGAVNISDFSILAANFGKSAMPFSMGNLDRSAGGTISITDFNILAAAFGKSMPAPTAPQSVSTESATQQGTIGTQSSELATTSTADSVDLLNDAGLV